jgi:hypothetical protein
MIHVVIFFTILGLTPAMTQAEPANDETRAGYEWARDNGVEDPQSCATESPAFNEGCLSFIAEAGMPAEDADEPAAATDGMPAGYDFPDDQFTILE